MIDWSKDDGSEEFAELVVRAAHPGSPDGAFGRVVVSESGGVFAEQYGEGYMYLGSTFLEARKHPTVVAWEAANRPKPSAPFKAEVSDAGWRRMEDELRAELKAAELGEKEEPTPAPKVERERFERWWEQPSDMRDLLEVHEAAWSAWKARAALTAAPQIEGLKRRRWTISALLVPR
jgi:hypothetical protein